MKDTTQSLCNVIGVNIKRVRKKKKIGQSALAEQIYLSRSSLSNIEIGNQQPTLKAIYEISIALKCEISEILPTTSEYQSIVSDLDSDVVELVNKNTNSNNKKTIDVLKEILSNDNYEHR
ncbi:helix-turn-helix transcriptional regulator [Maribacter sp. LLG6340-A2]|uniref:helix-turn-helix transcriptional regulator n=1 Tax=Maribacter sp. LLG6340-A2 TaxID=3160834 RepID=UPI00387056B9